MQDGVTSRDFGGKMKDGTVAAAALLVGFLVGYHAAIWVMMEPIECDDCKVQQKEFYERKEK